MGGKGVGDIATCIAGKTGISPRAPHRCGKQFTCRSARGGVECNSAVAPTQSDAPYIESETSNSASSAGGSCQIRRGPAKSRTVGLGPRVSKVKRTGPNALRDVRLRLADIPQTSNEDDRPIFQQWLKDWWAQCCCDPCDRRARPVPAAH